MALSKYAMSLEPDDREVYLNKLVLQNGQQLPDPYSLTTSWKSVSMQNVPNIISRDVTEYLLNTPSLYTMESIKAFKSLDAYDFFIQGHVQDCLIHDLNAPINEFCFVKSQVIVFILHDILDHGFSRGGP